MPFFLILFAHADHADEDIGLLFLVHALLERLSALFDGHGETHQALHARIVQHSRRDRPKGLEAELFLGPLVGDVTLAALARRVQEAAAQHPAHVGTDVLRRRLLTGKGVDHARLLPVVVVAEGVADRIDGALIHGFDDHSVRSFLFPRFPLQLEEANSMTLKKLPWQPWREMILI